MVTIREDGRERRVTAAEAFLLQLTQKGLAGDSAAARSSLQAIEAARAARGEDGPARIDTIILTMVSSGADSIIQGLGIATQKYPADQKRVRFELSPWIVEATIDRLGDRRLTEAEQREVWDNTRTPCKVRWPQWWTVRE
jgi:hypothetical protein